MNDTMVFDLEIDSEPECEYFSGSYFENLTIVDIAKIVATIRAAGNKHTFIIHSRTRRNTKLERKLR